MMMIIIIIITIIQYAICLLLDSEAYVNFRQMAELRILNYDEISLNHTEGGNSGITAILLILNEN